MRTPRVSVAVPVYNGAATIGEAIEALLAQTYEDIEVIVGDNASTDETPDIVRALAARDPRVRYLRHAVNIGANANYTFVARAARGEFLKWSAAGDWCPPTCIERCLEALMGRTDAVLAAPRTRLFVGSLAHCEDYAHDLEILDDRPLERLQRVTRGLRLNNAMSGVIRMSALRRTSLIQPYAQADVVLMGRLALMGRFLLVDERLLYRRMDPSSATALQDDASRMRHVYGPRGGTRLQFMREYLGWVRAAALPMPPLEWLRVMDYLTRRAYSQRYGLFTELRGIAAAWRTTAARG